MNKPILEIKDLTIALPKNADRNFAVENADLVIESVPERLDIKQEVFKKR